jgi:hypothetical protein
MTVEGPEGKHVLTDKGFKKVQNAAPLSRNNAVSGSKQESGKDSPNNKKNAWGVIDRHRGRELDPMATFFFVYSKDIDTANNRIKSESGFISLDDVNLNYLFQGYLKEKSLLHARYVATPGVHYQMRNWVRHPYGNEEPSNTIEVQLDKEGPEQVKIEVSYYAGFTSDKRGYRLA